MPAGRLVDHVHQTLRGDILANRYVEGEPISEVGVAQRFEIARPTARAAVERLIGEGLLVRSGYKAASVPRLTDPDIRELYASRAILEGFIHRALAEARNVPAEAIAANLMLRAASANGNSTGLITSDVSFHKSLISAFGNSRVTRMHSLLMGEAHLCMAQVQAKHALTAEVIADEHDLILAAISNGEVDRVEALTSYHLNHAKERLLESRASMISETNVAG